MSEKRITEFFIDSFFKIAIICNANGKVGIISLQRGEGIGIVDSGESASDI